MPRSVQPDEPSPAGRDDDCVILCRSPRFTVLHSYEVVYLEGEGVPGRLEIGWFYGDPAAAAIDPRERWCVTVGAGLIAYRLAPPWIPFIDYPGAIRVDRRPVHPGAPLADQWFDWGRGAGGERVVWLAGVTADDQGRFRAVGDDDDSPPQILIEPDSSRVTPGGPA